jgi:hypothetical protein
MKKTIKCIGIIALAAVIGFLTITCDSGGGGSKDKPPTTPDPTSSTYVSWDESGNRYVLTVWKKGTAKAAYVPANGDAYELVITIDGAEYKSSGTVKGNTSGKIELESGGTSFTIQTSGEAITAITAPNDIPTDKGKQNAPTSVTTNPTLLVLWGKGSWADMAKNVKITFAEDTYYGPDELSTMFNWETGINVAGYKKVCIQYVSDPGYQYGETAGDDATGRVVAFGWYDDEAPKKGDKNAYGYGLTGKILYTPNPNDNPIGTIKYLTYMRFVPNFNSMNDVSAIWLE